MKLMSRKLAVFLASLTLLVVLATPQSGYAQKMTPHDWIRSNFIPFFCDDTYGYLDYNEVLDGIPLHTAYGTASKCKITKYKAKMYFGEAIRDGIIQEVVCQYNSKGYLKSLDTNGKHYRYDYDQNGNLIKKALYYDNGELYRVKHISYSGKFGINGSTINLSPTAYDRTVSYTCSWWGESVYYSAEFKYQNQKYSFSAWIASGDNGFISTYYFNKHCEWDDKTFGLHRNEMYLLGKNNCRIEDKWNQAGLITELIIYNDEYGDGPKYIYEYNWE